MTQYTHVFVKDLIIIYENSTLLQEIEELNTSEMFLLFLERSCDPSANTFPILFSFLQCLPRSKAVNTCLFECQPSYYNPIFSSSYGKLSVVQLTCFCPKKLTKIVATIVSPSPPGSETSL